MRDKNEVKKMINLEQKQPFVYASGRYPSEYNKTTVAFPLTSGRHGNVLVYDLRYNINDLDPDKSFPIVKELCFNKCPAVAPLGVLQENDGWDKIGLSYETVQKNLQDLLAQPEFAETMRTREQERPDFPPADEPEADLYSGFLNDSDAIKTEAVRNADANKLADFHPDFDDERLPELLLHYKARNFPDSLSETEAMQWENYRLSRLAKQTPEFLKALEEIYQKDEYIGEELKLYFENLMAEDYWKTIWTVVNYDFWRFVTVCYCLCFIFLPKIFLRRVNLSDIVKL